MNYINYIYILNALRIFTNNQVLSGYMLVTRSQGKWQTKTRRRPKCRQVSFLCPLSAVSLGADSLSLARAAPASLCLTRTLHIKDRLPYQHSNVFKNTDCTIVKQCCGHNHRCTLLVERHVLFSVSFYMTLQLTVVFS